MTGEPRSILDKPGPTNDEDFERHLPQMIAVFTDYSVLTNHLMARLFRQLGVDQLAIYTRAFWEWYDENEDGRLRPERTRNGQPDKADEWSYDFHSGDMDFTNVAIDILVRAPIGTEYKNAFGYDFGLLQPHFFVNFLSRYVKLHPEYLPLLEYLRESRDNAKRAFATMHRKRLIAPSNESPSAQYALAPMAK